MKCKPFFWRTIWLFNHSDLMFFLEICDTIKGNESLVENVNSYSFLTPLSHNFKLLHFDANPITIEYLVTELWRFFFLKQCKTKKFEHYFRQYLKNNMADIRLIPLDHVTYSVLQRLSSFYPKGNDWNIIT